MVGQFRGFRAEHLKQVGWQAYRVKTYVNWCGHTQEVILFPREDGLMAFVPVRGEATLWPACWPSDLHRPARHKP
jgi:hypothetical protein